MNETAIWNTQLPSTIPIISDQAAATDSDCSFPSEPIRTEYQYWHPTDRRDFQYTAKTTGHKFTKPYPYYVVRVDEQGKGKQVWSKRCDEYEQRGDDWRLLYNGLGLHEASKEANPHSIVFFVEGEKKCENLLARKLLATTTTGGRGQIGCYTPDVFEILLDFGSVVILPDKNKPGAEYAQRVASFLCEIRKRKGNSPIWRAVYPLRISVLDLPGLKEDEDVADWLASHSVKELMELVYDGTSCKPYVEGDSDPLPTKKERKPRGQTTSHTSDAKNIEFRMATILAKVKGYEEDRYKPNSYKFCCPCHDDNNPSAYMNEGDNGKILMHCFACGSEIQAEDMLRALGFDGATAYWLMEGNDNLPKTEDPVAPMIVETKDPQCSENATKAKGSSKGGTAAQRIERAKANGNQLSYCWENIAAKGCLTVLSGPAKVGKATLIDTFLWHNENGTEFIEATYKSRVLYLTEENDQELQGRWDTNDIEHLESVIWVSKPQTFQSLPDLLTWITDDLHATDDLNQFDMLFLDSLTNWIAIKNENDNSEMARVINGIFDTIRKLNPHLSVVMVHHHGKPAKDDQRHEIERSRGGSAFQQVASMLVSYTRVDNKDLDNRQRQLTMLGRFHPRSMKVIVEWPETEPRLRIVDNGIPRNQIGSIEGLRTKLKLDGPMTLNELVKSMGTVPRTTMQQQLRKGVEEGSIWKLGSGKKNDPHRYILKPEIDPLGSGGDL